jgi:hypothetical protein
MGDPADIRVLVRDAVREILRELTSGGDASLPRAVVSPLMTVPEVAVLLRSTPKAIYHRIERGQLPGVVRDGGRVLVRRVDLLRSLAEGRGLSPRSR